MIKNSEQKHCSFFIHKNTPKIIKKCMKKIKVGIVGLGNLGTSVAKLVSTDDRFELIAIFSRRKIESPLAPVIHFDNIENYKGKIDIMFLCSGSFSSLQEQAYRVLKNFNTIDAFDTHAKINSHISTCQKIAKENQKVAFCSFGWDPGLFSLMRLIFSSIEGQCFTTWGKGISQGHTQALKQIKDVKDAVQYTIPNKHLIKKLKSGKQINYNKLHTRICYIYAEKNYQKIKKKILKTPNYFKGQKVKIKFVEMKQLSELKKDYHQGQVFTQSDTLNFSLKTPSNPMTTAKIMIAFSTVLNKYIKDKKFGAYSILEINFSYLDKLFKNFI